MGTLPLVVIGFVSPPTVTLWALGSGVPVPPVVVVTVRSPVVGVGVGQSIANAAVWVPPSATVTVFEFPPLTVQFAATSVSTTVWLPEAWAEKVTLPFGGIGWLGPASRVAV